MVDGVVEGTMYRFPLSLTLSTKTLAMITASTSYSAAPIVASKVSGVPLRLK